MAARKNVQNNDVVLSLRPPADAVPKVAVPSQGNGHSQQEKPAALTGLIGSVSSWRIVCT